MRIEIWWVTYWKNVTLRWAAERGWKVNGTGSMAGFSISCVESSGSAMRDLIQLKLKHECSM